MDALRETLERERAEHFATIEPLWLGGRAAPFFAAVREIAYGAMTRGQPDLEIERKYLLKRMPAIRALDPAVQEMEQGYLPGDRLAERLRRVRQDGQTRYYRTVKLGKGVSRIEVEEETTERVFRKMWPLTRGRRVRKRRYKVKEGGFTWEVDRFRDRRLVLCEVELPSEDTEPPLPRWLRRELVRDVTDEDEYANINLAK
jgi:CYTH domain-containing protein